MEGFAKKPKTFDPCLRGQQGWSSCDKYRKPHKGVCRLGGLGCYKCGMTSHISIDCTQVLSLIFFHCNHIVHKMVECPRLMGGAVTIPALATLKITNGCHSKVEALVVRGRSFQLSVEEAYAAPDVVTGMYLLFTLYSFIF